MSSTIKADRLCNLRDVIQRRELIATCLGPDLHPVFLTLAGRADYRLMNRLGASFPKLFANRSNSFRIHHFKNGAWLSVDLPATYENYHCVQPLPCGRWLALRGRAKSVSDKNAHIFDADGQLVRSFHAGDGIENCQATSNGQVWTSFFDEGVYSDVPTGQSGLVAFNEFGETIADFKETGEEVGFRPFPAQHPATSSYRVTGPVPVA